MSSSIVSWDGGEYTSSCGYCHKDSFVSTGVTSDIMAVYDYQNLVDRGWRRCGTDFYKPNNTRTCCPLYSIRCDAVNLQLTKSQKKVLRKFNAFLTKTKEERCVSPATGRHCEGHGEPVNSDPKTSGNDRVASSRTHLMNEVLHVETSPSDDFKIDYELEIPKDTNLNANSNLLTREEPPCSSAHDKRLDDSRPKCKKAKLMRLERWKAKMDKRGIHVNDHVKRVTVEKQLEDYLNEVPPETSARKLEITLVRPFSTKETIDECFKLYRKYQEKIHDDHDNSFFSYLCFLMESPLNEINYGSDSEAPPCGYGTFHQMYRVDGKLIAVGVLDILPKCVSSVYFFYDPDYMNLNLGTYGALRELELTRKLARESPQLDQYYLGYYIHSCQKMRYKAQWKPSYLLCPEAYTWHPISECLKKIEANPYSRLNGDPNAKSDEDDVDFESVKLITDSTRPPTSVRDFKGIDDRLKRIASEFAHLVGRSGAQKILLRCFQSVNKGEEGEESDEDNPTN